ncbi:MAG: hypothetical protein JST92_05565 [Deltaproteobacteria bacterium]|nr:hypothetical protein [Deltaproteobacteria bacterium]
MASKPRVALLTCEAWPELYDDEKFLVSRLRDLGADASVQVWTNPSVDWAQFDRIAIRSPWDYFQRIDEFRAFLTRLEALGARLENPVPLVRWNLDKVYLRELAGRGVRIVDTRFVEAGTKISLSALVAESGWQELILKPAISGGAWRTHKFHARDVAQHEASLAEFLPTTMALLQPFIPEIQTQGEWSLIFFGGTFSHAVIKQAKPGDFRVQAMFGGTFRRVEPPAHVLSAAQKALEAMPQKPLYVRIDGVERGGEFLLMEVEAIEPYLFFPAAPEAVDRYLGALLAGL